MKIAVVGPGAVGCYYGAKLARAGHDVHFLIRSDFESIRRSGISVLSPEGNFNVRPKLARHPAEIGPSDLILIALKSTARGVLAQWLPPLARPGTAVLTLQNGLGNEEALAALFPIEQILGGLCFVCLNRDGPGVVRHLVHGKIELGEFQRWPEPRTHDLATAFRNAGIPCAVRENLERAHWEKLAWNIPFNGLGVASCAGYNAVMSGQFHGFQQECFATDRLLADPSWFELVRSLAGEVIAAAHALGHKIPHEYLQELIQKTRVMGAYLPSTLLDFARGLPLELEALFREPARRAAAAGVPTPRLGALCSLLEALDATPAEARTAVHKVGGKAVNQAGEKLVENLVENLLKKAVEKTAE